jgi:hypothetical protein
LFRDRDARGASDLPGAANGSFTQRAQRRKERTQRKDVEGEGRWSAKCGEWSEENGIGVTRDGAAGMEPGWG